MSFISSSSPRFLSVVQGEFSISKEPDVILSTVLGSCVAVCLFDKGRSVGGMNHYLLPTGDSAGSGNVKYGVNAMELLINEILKIGGRRDKLEAKVFGGASMFESKTDIGASNVAFGKEFLSAEGIPIVSESTGGKLARRIHFIPFTGAARQMIVPAQEAPPARPAISPRPKRAAGGIDLF